MIISANIGKKQSRIGKRRARIAFWKSESKTLRKKHRSILVGAALLTVIILAAQILLCSEICSILRKLGVSKALQIIFIGASVVFETILFSLLNLGGRHLALSLYRKERTPNAQKITVGELFYSFGSKKRRSKSAYVLYSDLRKAISFLFILLIPLLFYASLGTHKITLFTSLICTLFVIFPSQSKALEWIFRLDRKTGESSAEPCSLSKYAVIGREKELGKMKNKARLRFALGCLIPIFGLAFIYFPYAWSNEAVCADCVSSELISPSAKS